MLQTCAERAYNVHLLPSTWLLSAIRIVESYYLTTPELPSDLECMETHWLVGLGWDLELGHGLGWIAILSIQNFAALWAFFLCPT